MSPNACDFAHERSNSVGAVAVPVFLLPRQFRVRFPEFGKIEHRIVAETARSSRLRGDNPAALPFRFVEQNSVLCQSKGTDESGVANAAGYFELSQQFANPVGV